MCHRENGCTSKLYISMTFAIMLGVIAHSFFLFIFYFYNVTPLFYFNIASVALYVVAIYLVLKKQAIEFTMILVSIELILHQTLSVYYLGLGYGFQYYLFAVPSFILLGEYKNRLIPSLVTLTTIGAIILINLHGLDMHATYEIPAYKELLYILNLTVSIICVATFVNLFYYISKHNEEALLEIQQKLTMAATIDGLTGIYNRAATMHHLELYYEKYITDNTIFSLALIDIDNFKTINDTYGHDIGDKYNTPTKTNNQKSSLIQNRLK